jgi:predicted Zn-dependent protease
VFLPETEGPILAPIQIYLVRSRRIKTIRRLAANENGIKRRADRFCKFVTRNGRCCWGQVNEAEAD